MDPKYCGIALAVATVAAFSSGPAGAAPEQELPTYRVVKTVPLGAPDKWDFVTFDPSSDRVFVSHRTKVDVVDARTGKLVGEFTEIGESHGVALVPSLGRGYADDAASKTLIVFDLKTLKKIAAPAAGVDADAVAYDPATRRVFVMDADGHAVSTVDAVKDTALGTVALGGAPEAAVADGKGKLFINIASTNEIVAFDTWKLTISARWPVPACEKPHGLAMDTKTDRLFVSCENARMLVVNAKTGSVMANLLIGKGTDDAAFDSERKLAFSSNGDGTLSVIAERGPNDFVSLGDVKTVPGARTMALDPATGRVFLVTADVASTLPPKKPGGRPHPVYAPGSVKLLILSPDN